MSEPKLVLTWKCLRCHAEQAWLNRNRTKCGRCGAGREWLEKGYHEWNAWYDARKEEARREQ